MPAEKGIFLDVLPRFDMAAMGAILTGVENMFKKSGAAMGASFGTEAEARITATAEAQRKAANVTEDAELRQSRAIHATEIAEQQREVAVQRTLLAKARLLELQASEEASTNAVTAAAIRYNAAKTAEARAVYAAADAKTADIARTRDLAVATGLSNDALDKHNAALAASTVTAGNFGRVMMVAGGAITAGFVVGAAEATKMAGDFQQSLIKLQASAGETGTMTSGNLKIVSDGILQLAGQVGVSANTLAEAMFGVEKAGFQGADGIKVLTAASQLANAEGADLHETIQGLTTSMSDFGYSADQAAVVASKMNTAVGMSKVPLQDFSNALHNVEPTAAAAKLSLDSVYAAMARITQSGAGADQASDWLNNTIQHLVNMNDQQKTFIQQLGGDPQKMQEDLANPQIGLNGVLKEGVDLLKSQMNPQQQIILDTQLKSVQAVQDLNTMYDKLGPKSKQIADDAKAGTLDKQDLQDLRIAKANESALAQWKTLYDKLNGYNSQLKKGQADVLSNAQAMLKMFGTDSAFKVSSLLVGTDADTQKYDQALATIKNATAQADGTVKGFNETQDGLNKKMADAKAGFGAAAIQIGQAFIPAMTLVTNGLKDAAQWLAQNKIVGEAVIGTMGLIAAAWTVSVAKMAFAPILAGIKAMAIAYDGVKVSAGEANLAMEASGPAAAKGEAGVVAATAGEEAAIGGVTTATEGVAGAASVAIGAFGALAAAAAAWMVWGNDKLKDLGNNAENARGHGAEAIAERGGHGPGQTMIGWQGVVGGHNGPHGGYRDKQMLAQAQALAAHPPGDPTAAVPDSQSMIDQSQYTGDSDAGLGATGAPAIGTQNNPIYTDPQSITDGLNASDLGSQGTVGGTLMSIFTDAGSGGFTLANVAKLLTTFTVNLALGNPAGKLATGQFGGGDSDSDLTSSISDIENMTPTERIEKENTIKMQKAIRTYQNALRDYAAALRKYGPGSAQALDAEDSVFNARDAIDQTTIDQQQAGGTAAQNYANDLANGTATKNPGKFAKDKAAAGAYTSGDGSGNASAYPGDQALLSTIPTSGDKYVNPGGTFDLSKGLADCSSAVGDLVKTLDGQATGGGNRLNTGNASTWLPQHGFLPNTTGANVPGAFNVGYNDHHMQATLPGGTNFNWGSDAAAQEGGVNGGGAFDPAQAFTTHYYRPGASGAPAAAPSLTDPSNTNPGLTNPGGGTPNATSTTNGGGGGDGWGLNALPSIIPGSGGGNGFLGLRQAPMAPAPAASGPISIGGGALPGAGAGAVQSPGMQLGRPATGAPGAGRGTGNLQGSTNGAQIGAPAAPPGGVGKTATGGLTTAQPAGGSGPGAGASGGGLLGGAIGAAEAAANMFAPGAGAGVQILAEEGERAAKFAGQAAGIAVQGLQETFTLHSPDGGDSGKGGWLGKIAGGLAGAHPAQPNGAGALTAKDPKASDKSPSAPGLKPGDAPPGGPKPGDPNSPGPGNGAPMVNIENQNINHGDGGQQNRDMVRQMTALPMMN